MVFDPGTSEATSSIRIDSGVRSQKFKIQILAIILTLLSFYRCGRMKVSGIPYKIGVDQIVETETTKRLSFSQLVDHLGEVPIIYIGESHANPQHHEIQMRVISALYHLYGDIFIGIEMFDRSKQDILDRWIKNELSEQDLIKEWLKGWQHDYELYKPILNFAREHALKLVALNAPSNVVKKIARKGLEELTQEEREQIASIDTSNETHKQYIRRYYETHKESDIRDFDTFYQAQCAWEDTMAETIAGYVTPLQQENRKMVALVGNAHIAYSLGVPERAYKRSGLLYKTLVLLEMGREAESKEIAHYVWVTEVAPKKKRVRIGLKLRRCDSESGVLIEAVDKKSPAERCGLKPRDIILKVDDRDVYELVDMHLAFAKGEDKKSYRIVIKRAGTKKEVILKR